MRKEFIESNIVIIGEFKPSVYDKYFFIKNKLIPEEKFNDETFYITPKFCRLDTEEISIDIDTERVAIINKLDSVKAKDIAHKIISESENKIKAVGLNFKWFIFIDKSIPEYTQEIFYSPNNKIINNHFNTKDVAYGYYVSKEFNDSRMRLDVKPMRLKEVDSNIDESVMVYDFNFHIEEQNNFDIHAKALENYLKYEKEVKNIISSYD